MVFILDQKLVGKDISSRCLVGSSVEIGALHLSLEVSFNVKIHYLDCMKVEQHYPELSGYKPIDVEIIDVGETLASIVNN
jgi:hypothetical protein